jgi:hypothetical protein
LRESHPCAGQFVQPGRFDPPLAITAKLAVTQVVGHDQHDIWAVASTGGNGASMNRKREIDEPTGNENQMDRNSGDGQH